MYMTLSTSVNDSDNNYMYVKYTAKDKGNDNAIDNDYDCDNVDDILSFSWPDTEDSGPSSKGFFDISASVPSKLSHLSVFLTIPCWFEYHAILISPSQNSILGIR